MADPLKKIVDEISSITPKKRANKANRTLHLDNDPFVRLQKHCRNHGVTVASVIDKLIAAYLGQLPPEDETAEEED
jgi:hypothetical protein